MLRQFVLHYLSSKTLQLYYLFIQQDHDFILSIHLAQRFLLSIHLAGQRFYIINSSSRAIASFFDICFGTAYVVFTSLNASLIIPS